MSKGKIVDWRGSYGFIEGDHGNGRLFFHISQSNLDKDRIYIGLEVEYEVGEGQKGPTGQNVRLASSAVPPSKGYRFLNPYNFIRPLPRHRELPDDTAEVKLFNFAPPPPHDRWLGMSGVIECDLKTITPLFISGAEGVETLPGDNNKPHHRYRFFRLNGQKAIPASSLRGAIRSLYEAVTNSPLTNLSDTRLSYRLPSREVQKLVPARVIKEGNSWYLQLLPGDAPFSPELGQKKGLYAAPVRFYKALKPTGKRRQDPPAPIAQAETARHGNAYFAIMREVKFPPSWRVLALYENRENAEQELPNFRPQIRSNIQVEQGWLCKTNQNSDNKNSERFFFRDKTAQRTVPEHIPLKKEIRQKYEDLILDYQTRHAADVRKRKRPSQIEGKDIAFSRYVLNEKEKHLHGGELVFARLSGNVANLEVEFIAPVSWPRVAYNHTIGDLLPNYLQPSSESQESLSPASRLFGWVEGEDKGQGAYAGRVRFTHALRERKGEEIGEQTLAILGSPKPTTTRFYLLPPNGKPANGRSDIQAGYDGNNGKNRLRGRKLYRHFVPDSQHMTRQEKSDQNRTIHDPEGEGAIFKFRIEYENLAPVELGALLWTLTLGQKGYHRLGYGKPLGLGSVEIQPYRVVCYDFAQRYRSIGDTGWHIELSSSQQQKLMNNFQRAFITPYVRPHLDRMQSYATEKGEDIWREAFEELPNIADILTLLGKTPPSLPVHYPHSPDPSSKGQFEWFVGNNRLSGPRLELSLTHEDEGLPLIDKRGSTHH